MKRSSQDLQNHRMAQVTNWFRLRERLLLTRAALFLAGVRQCPTQQFSPWENMESGAGGGTWHAEPQTTNCFPDRSSGVRAIGLSLLTKGWITTHSVLSVMKAIKTKSEWASPLPCKSNMDSLMREGHYLSSHSSFTHVRNVAHIGN